MKPLTLWLTKGREHNVASLLAFLVANKPSSTSPARVLVCLDETTPRGLFLEHAQYLYNAALEHSPDCALTVIPVCGCAADGVEAPTTASAPVQRLSARWMLASSGFTPCYRYVAVGGTFDHLHSGHKLLLSTALLYATEKLRVGVTGDALLHKKKFREQLQPMEVRMTHVRAFLEELRSDVELDIDVIADVSGGTDVIADVEALVVSPETEASLPTINELRRQNGFAPLVPVRIPYVETSSGTHISSTYLRERLAGTAPPTA